MAELCQIQSWGKSSVLAYFGLKIGYFGHFVEIRTSNLICPSFTLIVRDRPNQKSIGPNLTIMSSKKRRNGHISKRHFGQESITKSQLLHFSMNLSETFSIDVNMDFANNLGSGILVQSHQKYCEPKIKKRDFLYLKFFAKPLSKFCDNPYFRRF